MNEIIQLVVTYGSLGLSAFLGLCVLGGLIFGLIRGAKRSLLRLILIILCLVLATVLAPMFFESALMVETSTLSFSGIDFGSATTVEEFVIITIEGEMQGVPADAIPNTILAAFAVVGAVLSLVIFLILFGVLRFLTWLIIFPILKLIFLGGDRKKKKEAKHGYGSYKKHRLLGAGFGLIQGVAVMLALIVPVAALVDTAQGFSDGLGDAQIQVAEGESDPIGDILKLVEALNDAYTKSVAGAIYAGTGIDKLIYERLVTVEIDGETFTLRSVAEMGGEVYVTLGQLSSLELPENATEQQTIEFYDNLLQTAKNVINVVFDNGLVRIVLNDIGNAIKSGAIDLPKLLESLTGGGSDQNSPKNMSKQAVEEQTDESFDIMEVVLAMLFDMVDDMANSGDFAKALKDTLTDIIDLATDLNNDGIIYMVMQLAEDPTAVDSLMSDQEGAKKLGGALDKMLENSTLGRMLFSIAEGMISDAMTGMGIELGDVDLTKVKWESAMETAFEFLAVSEEFASGNIDSQAIVRIIGTLNGQLTDGSDNSGIIRAFEGIIKGFIADMGIAGVDMEFLKDIELDIIEENNKLAIGALIDLMNELNNDPDMYKRIAQNATNLSSDDLEDIDNISQHVKKLNNTSDGLKSIINKVIGSMMGESIGSNAIQTLNNSLDAFKLLIEMQSLVANTKETAEKIENWETLDDSDKEELLGNFGIEAEVIEELKGATQQEVAEILTEKIFDEGKADELLDLVADEGIINMIEEATGGSNIEIKDDAQKEIVQEAFDKKVDDIVQQIADSELSEEEKEQLQTKLDMLDKLGGMLGLDPSKFLPK